ncbi:hypothetical protein SFV1gp38 [Sulfolobus filamentous virus 1]|uniref:Uncharacterized protein n=2 Tax=Alphalipothrixvirus beppuense TaxID=2734584 RepID=A0A346LU77_SUFV1|nr:hypothetical protein HOT91_gp38 [Sulfolobus filamentous virus 1]AXQ00120.1 hypothetical protein SFV1gp38 [Sulfolobus filamentous virus 1]AZI75740.1 hypothetical protein SBFV1_gp39 [Sulfolobales Beppu filamentous phage 1]
MQKTDHEIRFAYALYILFALILHCYHNYILLSIFLVWLTYENVFAIMRNLKLSTLIISNVIGLVTFYAVYTFDLIMMLVVLPIYLGYGLYLNYLGLRK